MNYKQADRQSDHEYAMRKTYDLRTGHLQNERASILHMSQGELLALHKHYGWEAPQPRTIGALRENALVGNSARWKESPGWH